MYSIFSKFTAASLCALLLFTVACSGQSTAVALLNAAGPAVASVVTVIDPGNPALAQKIKTDFAAAAGAVGAWKNGTPCQDVETALNLVLSDLNLIPVGSYAAVIAVAIAGVESVLAAFPACQQAGAVQNTVAMPVVTPAQFKKLWNQQVAQHPELKSAAIK